MDAVLLIKSIVMGVVEGLTEFLPISSTGHLILAGSLLNFNSEKGKVFEVVIQSGAMLAVVWEYRQRFLATLRGLVSDPTAQRFVVNLAIAFLPAAVLGVIFGSLIKTYLFSPIPVALAFIVGGVIIWWAERRSHRIAFEHVDDVNWPAALQIGLAQCFALIPGTSRAGATIVGGLLIGLSRKAATEFSFYLAVPTLLAAGLYDLYKERALLSAGDVGWFGVGVLTAFIAAFLSIRWLMRFISSHDFTVFAVYRIIFGAVVLLSAYFGLVQWDGCVKRVLAVLLVASCLSPASIAEAQRPPGGPMRIVLLVDSSPAMSPMLLQFRAALKVFVDGLPIEAEPEIVFGSTGGQLRVRVGPTIDRAKLYDAISLFAPDSGGNVLVDSILEADQRFLKNVPDRRSVFVILTTDADREMLGVRTDRYNRFVADLREREGRAHGIVIQIAQTGMTAQLVQNLTDNTGGFFEAIGTPTSLPKLMATLAAYVAADL